MDPYTLARATNAEDTVRKWAYAESLERDLLAVKANLEGMEALKDAAMKQLAKANPNDYLMTQANRQAVFDAAYDKFVAAARR
ncbi:MULTISPECIES: hypothetical protein [unclassified Caballeronia]|uniref:hypothetical protein n=1 Tax=unclassified Caballeronia TaxID=2646786 RepID=UPI002029B167|nr:MULTISPECIES: hypothetical protein [unclassified Caballeronia]